MNVRFSSSLIFLKGLFLLSSFQEGKCQDFSPGVTSLSIEDGLSQSTVSEIIHDQNGFMWIATRDGLNRFDGYSFKVFRSDPEDSTTLCNNAIKSMALDPQGNLWLGTQTGLCKYDIRKAKFTRYLTQDGVGNRFSNVVNDIIIHGEGIWLATDEGLLHASDFKQPVFNFFPAFDEYNQLLSINEFFYGEEGYLLLGTDKGLFRFNTTSSEFSFIDIGQGRKAVLALTYAATKIWVGTDKGLISFRPDQFVSGVDGHYSLRSFDSYPNLVNKQIHHVFGDSSSKIWVSTSDNGLYCMNTAEGALRFENYQDADNLFSSVSAISMFEDLSKNLWLGTRESGLYQIKNTNKVFRLIRNGLSSEKVRGILEDGDKLWVGTSKGLTLVNKKTGSFQILKSEEGGRNGLSHNNIKELEITPDGDLWVATENGLNRLDTSAMSFQSFYAEDKVPLIRANRVWTLAYLSDNYLWVGTLGGGITVIDPKSNKLVESYYSIPEDENSLSSNQIIQIFESSDQTVWVSTFGGGLCRLNRADNTIYPVLYDKLPRFPFSISEDDDGLLWVGTNGHGFYSINPVSLDYQIYSEKEGLSNNIAYAVIPYKEDVWISTNSGINKFNKSTGNFTVFNENDGLQSNEFNAGSFLKGKDGLLYFGGVNGLTFFHPDSISHNLFVPKSAFTDFKIFNEVIYPDQVVMRGHPPLNESISDSSTVQLSHFHNSFTIEFTSLDYANAEGSKYAYRLMGFDLEWEFIDARQRSVTYTNLPAGDYTFQVKACNDDGIWSDQPITLFVSIEPSLYGYTWFRLTVSSILLFFLGLVIYKRVKNSQTHKKFLESEISERTKEIFAQNELLSKSETYLKNLNKKKDQMFYILTHNVRAPLTTLVGLLKSKTDEDITDERYNRLLDDLQHQVRDSLLLLDNAFYWSLIQFERIPEKREQIVLNSLINQQIHKYNRYASFKNVRINFNNKEEEEVRCDRLMTSIIIQNLISNAIKYSHKGGDVNVRFEKGDDTLRIVVEDFGIGLTEQEINRIFNNEESVSTPGSQKEKGTGLGLLISQIFAKKMGFSLAVQSEKDSYSRFFLEIPES